jgi:hypothetical protein
MTSPLEAVEVNALASLPLRGEASLAELVVDTSLKPAELQEGLRLLERRNLIVSSPEAPQRYRLTGLGRSARRSLDSRRFDSLAGPAIMLDIQETAELQEAKNHIDDELDQELGPVNPELAGP